MGKRSREDPAGHQVRGKGEPTEQAEQNRDVEHPPAPGMLCVLIPTGYTGQLATHPRFGKRLDLAFTGAGGAQALIRMSPGDWPSLREAVDQLLREAELAPDGQATTESGIVLPSGGADVKREAEAAAAREQAETEMREGK